MEIIPCFPPSARRPNERWFFVRSPRRGHAPSVFSSGSGSSSLTACENTQPEETQGKTPSCNHRHDFRRIFPGPLRLALDFGRFRNIYEACRFQTCSSDVFMKRAESNRSAARIKPTEEVFYHAIPEHIQESRAQHSTHP